jgi:hypothetical protein
VVAAPLDQARDKARRMLGPGVVRIDDSALDLAVEPGMAPAINRALVAEGIAVHELKWQAPDLERVFLELTEGGAKHVA